MPRNGRSPRAACGRLQTRPCRPASSSELKEYLVGGLFVSFERVCLGHRDGRLEPLRYQRAAIVLNEQVARTPEDHDTVANKHLLVVQISLRFAAASQPESRLLRWTALGRVPSAAGLVNRNAADPSATLEPAISTPSSSRSNRATEGPLGVRSACRRTDRRPAQCLPGNPISRQT